MAFSSVSLNQSHGAGFAGFVRIECRFPHDDLAVADDSDFDATTGHFDPC
jgi:hypothetical protein